MFPIRSLGGSVPRLQFFWMNAVRPQGLQKLLLSATHLIDLHLIDIPDHISSQRMASYLPLRVKQPPTLSLAFQHHLYSPYQENR